VGIRIKGKEVPQEGEKEDGSQEKAHISRWRRNASKSLREGGKTSKKRVSEKCSPGVGGGGDEINQRRRRLK